MGILAVERIAMKNERNPYYQNKINEFHPFKLELLLDVLEILLPNGVVSIIHSNSNSGTLEIINSMHDASGSISSSPFHFQLACTGD